MALLEENRPALPLLYTFRRCPYAMRARWAIAASGVTVQQHEVSLKDKPAQMLAVSPKGTVPVLVLPGGVVIEQSIEIMHWALEYRDPLGWLPANDEERRATHALIECNDRTFKPLLDRYKYWVRFPEQTQAEHLAAGLPVLQALDQRLTATPHLVADRMTLADAALFPFVRQWAMSDAAAFDALPLPALHRWYRALDASALFESVMRKLVNVA